MNQAAESNVADIADVLLMLLLLSVRCCLTALM